MNTMQGYRLKHNVQGPQFEETKTHIFFKPESYRRITQLFVEVKTVSLKSLTEGNASPAVTPTFVNLESQTRTLGL